MVKRKGNITLKNQPRFHPAPMLSKEQDMMQEMFSGNDMWGTGKNLPKMEGALTTGNGLIKCDDYGETRRMFGGF